ncbi:hypothetical protein LTR10_014411 [Elasticomyces elasticus]|uniref:Uncharacterized protein n=1 Tax=Exophiala sideris TaxID=1016849 RepID=A0ABR0J0P2_9EURO|nr:hypothetical protein LTR10_014411 [Elasticomyces elasticus]KAK5023676.1 hypothetical protein LTS07_009184 [Exophiala sideris]KAK5029676.1 hypothetical protein LTR13_008596 [Exophiala sideris]KAK5053465.1 hypothetical protein LTR69_009423 [Exophiala sideris]KAK5179223.1 hypothetical protein LTR44_008377 [Eurotiomycetes sp. CCFEE 6388]
MGNEQSQESSAPPRPEEPDHTDLSDIPDDREPDEDGDTTITAQPVEVRKPAKEKMQKKKKKKKKRVRRSTERESSEEAPVLSQVIPTQEQIELLRKREPEAFDVYATSDVSDGEGSKTNAPLPARDTTSADADDEQAIEDSPDGAGNEEASEESPAEVDDEEAIDENSAAADDEEAIADSQPVQPVINGHLSNTDDTPAVRVVSDVLPAEVPVNGGLGPKRPVPAPTNASVPDPKRNDEDRYLCPFSDTHDCRETFAKRKSAVRHASIHTQNYACIVCDKKLSRADTLQRHLAKHTAVELALAEARVSHGHEADEVEASAPLDNETAEGPQGGDSPGYSTPQETSQAAPIAADEGARHDSDGPPDADVEEHDIGVTNTRKVNGSDQDAPSGATNVPENNIFKGEQERSKAADSSAVSETQSPSPSSVFEEPEENSAATETVRANGLKRKRASLEAAQTPVPTTQKPTKRRKRIQNSPPTSGQSEVIRSESPAFETTTKKALSGQITEKIIPTLRKGRQGTIDGWARSNSVTSQSPAPPAGNSHVEVVVPLSQAGPSGGFTSVNGNSSVKESQKLSNKATRPNGLDAFTLKKARRAAYTTPKGKKRADPDIDYSTPATVRRTQDEELDDSDAAGPSQMATSVAKRTFPGSQSRRAGSQEEDADSDFEDDDKASKSEPRPPVVEDKPVECRKCHFRFKTEDGLRKHLKKANVHSNLYGCDGCTERFWNTRLLAKHETDTGHGKGDTSQGRTGPFSEREVRALQNWRDTFCGLHNITSEQFNEMMTDSLNRTNARAWPWHFISRTQFLNEYLEVLPGRNKRSMLRYRERNFQNLEGSRNWSAEDDKELIRLYKQFGSKWSEIAKRLTRTTDAVSQRWRHKLQHRDVDKGIWTENEITKFSNALVQVRRESGPVADSQDWQVPWNKISQKVGSRTPQQCSNHYRAVHGMKQGGRWVKVEGLEKTPGSSRILTPSKMERRLRGDKIESSLGKPISSEFVEDENDDQGEEAAAGNGNEQENEENQDQEDGDDQEEEEELPESAPRLPRNPLNHKTPGKALQLSQLFNHTQANTSALRRSPETMRQAPSQDVPSPSIPIQRRALSQRSPLQEIKVKDNGDLDIDEEEDQNEVADEPEDAVPRGAVTDQDDFIPLDQDANESDADAGSGEDDDEEQNGGDDAASNDFLNSIEESAQRVRSSQLQPRLVQTSARSSRRKGWSLSPSESSDESDG